MRPHQRQARMGRVPLVRAGRGGWQAGTRKEPKMRKCEYCGREGSAPDVRGAKSASVSIGNYRMPIDVDVALCERCAERIMAEALDVLTVELTVARPR